MKFIFRNHLLRWASYMEIFLSLLLLIGVLISAIGLVMNVFDLTQNLNDPDYFQKFLGATMALIIALELIKMITRDSAGSTIEVLLIAIARKLIVSEEDALGFLIGVVALGFLFFIRKYLFVSEFNTQGGIVVSAAMPIVEAEKLIKQPLPHQPHTVGGLVAQLAEAEGRKLNEGEVYAYNGVKLRINRIEHGIIQVLEFIDSHE